MTDVPIQFSLTFDPSVTRAALRFRYSPKPKRPAWQMLVFGLVRGGLIGALILAVLRLGFGFDDAGDYYISGVIGVVATYVLSMLLAKRRVNYVLGLLADMDRQEGAPEASFGAKGVTCASPNAQSQLGGLVISAIDAVPGGTILLFGASHLVVPDYCLPAGLTAPAFRSQLIEWRSAHV